MTADHSAGLDLAAIEGRHVREESAFGSVCKECWVAWPCEAGALFTEVRRLREQFHLANVDAIMTEAERSNVADALGALLSALRNERLNPDGTFSTDLLVAIDEGYAALDADAPHVAPEASQRAQGGRGE